MWYKDQSKWRERKKCMDTTISWNRYKADDKLHRLLMRITITAGPDAITRGEKISQCQRNALSITLRDTQWKKYKAWVKEACFSWGTGKNWEEKRKTLLILSLLHLLSKSAVKWLRKRFQPITCPHLKFRMYAMHIILNVLTLLALLEKKNLPSRDYLTPKL